MASSSKHADKFLSSLNRRNNLPSQAYNTAARFIDCSDALIRDMIIATASEVVKKDGINYLKKISKIDNPRYIGSHEWFTIIYAFLDHVSGYLSITNEVSGDISDSVKFSLLIALDLGEELNSPEIIRSIQSTADKLQTTR